MHVVKILVEKRSEKESNSSPNKVYIIRCDSVIQISTPKKKISVIQTTENAFLLHVILPKIMAVGIALFCYMQCELDGSSIKFLCIVL